MKILREIIEWITFTVIICTMIATVFFVASFAWYEARDIVQVNSMFDQLNRLYRESL